LLLCSFNEGNVYYAKGLSGIMPYRLVDGKPESYTYTAAEVSAALKDRGIKYLDLQFVNLTGRLQHITISAAHLDSDSFISGIPKVDGSSIKGFTGIEDSDLIFIPDPSTFVVLPWYDGSIARIMGDIYCDMGRKRLDSDSRSVAQNAEKYLNGLGYTALLGPELEYFVFGQVHWDALTGYRQSYSVDSEEAPWADNPYRMRYKEGYYPAPPYDPLMEYRSKLSDALAIMGLLVEAHHHEVAAAGQIEVNTYRDYLLETADAVTTHKYAAKMVGQSLGKWVTFMPKPIFGDNASGMHVNISVWSGKHGKHMENKFFDENDKYAQISQMARYFVGGLLSHTRSLAAIVAPTTNSYKRLVPGYEAPTNIAWSRGNRSANVRIPIYNKGSPSNKRIEYRTPDPSCNPYLALSAILLAGMDGVKKKIEPPEPVDEDLYSISPERAASLRVGKLPKDLSEAIEELQSDKEYLKPAFTDSLLDKIIQIEKKEITEVSARPHPYEYHLYFDV